MIPSLHIEPQEGVGATTPIPMKERKASVKMALGDPEGQRDQDDPERVREEVAHQEVAGARAEEARGLDVLRLAELEDLAARQPGRAGPGEEDHRDEHRPDAALAGADPERDPEEDHEEQERQRHDEVGEPHDPLVHPPAHVAGDPAEEDADQDRQERSGEADEERDPPTREEPGEQVAAERVGPERAPGARHGLPRPRRGIDRPRLDERDAGAERQRERRAPPLRAVRRDDRVPVGGRLQVEGVLEGDDVPGVHLAHRQAEVVAAGLRGGPVDQVARRAGDVLPPQPDRLDGRLADRAQRRRRRERRAVRRRRRVDPRDDRLLPRRRLGEHDDGVGPARPLRDPRQRRLARIHAPHERPGHREQEQRADDRERRERLPVPPEPQPGVAPVGERRPRGAAGGERAGQRREGLGGERGDGLGAHAASFPTRMRGSTQP